MCRKNISRNLEQRIKENFYLTVPPKVPDSFAKYGDYFSDTQLFWGKTWEEMTLAQFESFPLIFGSLPTDFLPYFLGAYMYLSLEEPNSALNSLAYICASPILLKQKKYHNQPKMQSIRSALSEIQLDLFSEYLLYIVNNFNTPHKDSFSFSYDYLVRTTPITPPTG